MLSSAANGRAQYDTMLGAGGRQFHGPFGLSVAKNITSDPDQGLGKWTDAEIERAIRKGIDRQGHPLKPPMGFGRRRRRRCPEARLRRCAWTGRPAKVTADDRASARCWLI